MNSAHGVLFLLTGNSGAGKDTVLNKAISVWPETLPEIKVARRVITRKPHPSEPFSSVNITEFIHMNERGEFAFTWHSYGKWYGVPTDIYAWLESGYPVVVNVSRNIISSVRKQFPNVRVIFLSVPANITRERLKKRHREDLAEQERRLERAMANQHLPDADLVIDNTGTIHDSAEHLATFMAHELETRR